MKTFFVFMAISVSFSAFADDDVPKSVIRSAILENAAQLMQQFSDERVGPDEKAQPRKVLQISRGYYDIQVTAQPDRKNPKFTIFTLEGS